MQRFMYIEDSQVYWCEQDGFKCEAKTFTAVNLAIKVIDSSFYRNEGHGFLLERLALVECSIEGSHFTKNSLSNVNFSQVHNWQDTKYAVEIRKSEFILSEDDGITVFDTGFYLSGCKIKDNKGNGVFLFQKIPHNQQLISGSIKDYISRSPMCVMISECEFSKN